MADDRSSISLVGEGPVQDVAEAKLAALEAGLHRTYEALPIAGMAAGLLHGRDLVWFKGLGYADLAEKRPVTPDTPFHLASLTKTFTSTLLLQLVEQGKLDLDTAAADYGIELDSRGTVTVRHLFSHTSGGTPGERYRYDGARFGLLDRVIEQATGCDFEDHLKRTIVRPLGLRNTGRMGDSFDVPLASPYALSEAGGLEKASYPTYFGSSAGLVASLSDYAHYILALKGNRFLRPETLAMSMTATRSTASQDLPYGLGWFVETVEGTAVVWHYGFWDSVSSLVVMVPEQDLAFFAFANTDALSRGFDLGDGRIVRSPAGRQFLKCLALARD